MLQMPPVPPALGDAREDGETTCLASFLYSANAPALPPPSFYVPIPFSGGKHTCRVYILAVSEGPTQFPSCPGLCIERKQMALEFPGVTPISGSQLE